ncbi:MAG: hypothetical protein JNK05_03490 [Myxococcales bacterium]|nr:hypothetical protein [Myxococcales bacterium]
MRAPWLAAAATLVACASPTPTRVATSRSSPAEHAHVAGPAQLTLEPVHLSHESPTGSIDRAQPIVADSARAANDVTLVARLSLDAYADVPVTVTIDLPSNASLRAGRSSFTIPNIRPGSIVEERYTVAFASGQPRPVGAITVRAHARGSAFGFTAVARWNDGATPPTRRIVADGTPLVMGRHRFGPSIRAGR